VLLFSKHVPEPAAARNGSARVCRYLAAFAWELRGRLTGGPLAVETRVLDTLLPPEEAKWMADQRHRPLQLLCALRFELLEQYRVGNLPAHIHRKLEEDVLALDTIVGGCERLFSSPLPPTMSRHIVRCLQLWLLGLPFVLAGTMAPISVAIWVFVVSYAFVGIDEVGVQVEQPFEVLPMTTMCNIIMANLDETFLREPLSSASAFESR
jgi:putative membrane protein